MTSNGGRNSNSGFNGAPPKYLNDFSKALAGEVRILLEEVGKLRDERRQLQFEIAELMAVKSKHSLGGQYAPPEWLAKQLEPPPPAPASEEIVPAPPPQPAAPAWRTVHKRPERRPKSTKAIEPPQAPASPAPGPPPMPSGPGGPAWAQWRHAPYQANPLLSPAPRQGTPGSPFPAPPPPSRGGLFGPPSPPPK